METYIRPCASLFFLLNNVINVKEKKKKTVTSTSEMKESLFDTKTTVSSPRYTHARILNIVAQVIILIKCLENLQEIKRMFPVLRVLNCGFVRSLRVHVRDVSTSGNRTREL